MTTKLLPSGIAITRRRFWTITVIIVGVVTILSADFFLTPYLFLFMDPFTSSIIIETIIVAIIVVASYGIHSKLLNKD